MKAGFYLIAYDVPDNRQRGRLAKLLESYGPRVQYSVFELELTDTELQQLQRSIQTLLTDDGEHVRIYSLCRACLKKIQIYGSLPIQTTPDHYFI